MLSNNGKGLKRILDSAIQEFFESSKLKIVGIFFAFFGLRRAAFG